MFAQNFLCATCYPHSYLYRKICITHVRKTFLKENLCALQIVVCALISRPLCARTRAQLRGNIVAIPRVKHGHVEPQSDDLKRRDTVSLIYGKTRRHFHSKDANKIQRLSSVGRDRSPLAVGGGMTDGGSNEDVIDHTVLSFAS